MSDAIPDEIMTMARDVALSVSAQTHGSASTIAHALMAAAKEADEAATKRVERAISALKRGLTGQSWGNSLMEIHEALAILKGEA